jgi:hypothetical protein
MGFCMFVYLFNEVIHEEITHPDFLEYINSLGVE